jgi:hypothetical protein
VTEHRDRSPDLTFVPPWLISRPPCYDGTGRFEPEESPMEITIVLSPEEETLIQSRATASGEDIASYLQGLIHRHIKAPIILAEVLAPIRREFAESGMSEDELDALVEEARDEIWRTKRAQASDGA